MTVKNLYEQVRDGRIVSDIDLQREIIYNTEKQELVIDSIVRGIPLPAFYLWRNSENVLEVLDGKQRIEAIKRFKENDLEYDGKIWKNTVPERQEKINSTELSIIVCEGDDVLKREIFKRINTLGVPLSPYEVLNGLLHGEYLRGLSAFVEQDRKAKKILGSNSRGKNQMRVLRWLLEFESTRQSVSDYVAARQDYPFEVDQRRIMRYISFIADVFSDYAKVDIYFRLAVKYIKDVSIWKEHKTEINQCIRRFLKSEDAKFIADKEREIEDIIQAVVCGISVDPKRLFTRDDKQALCDGQTSEDNKYRCAHCGQLFAFEELTVDHIKAWSLGGRTELSNARLLCRPCNSKLGNRN